MRRLLLLLIGLSLSLMACTPNSSRTNEVEIEPTVTPEEMMRTQISASNPDIDQPGSYVIYSPETFDQYVNQQRVLFFHAAWCPTCRLADKEFSDNLDQIPANVVVLKTDYDTETELKQKYGITYQHTFVLVDENGNELAKWNGGGVDELIDKTNV